MGSKSSNAVLSIHNYNQTHHNIWRGYMLGDSKGLPLQTVSKLSKLACLAITGALEITFFQVNLPGRVA